MRYLRPRWWRAVGLMLAGPAWLLFVGAGSSAEPAPPSIGFSDEERQRILSHGPWPPAQRVDPSNRFDGLPEAIELGRQLFFDPRLSANGKVSCASCHDPARGFADGRPRAIGIAPGDRNSQGLLNVGLQRWYGWDGGADSLWAASLRPMLAAHEMGGSAATVAARIRSDNDLWRRLAAARLARPAMSAMPAAPETPATPATPVTPATPATPATSSTSSAPPATDDEHVLVDAGKAIGAFLATLVSPRTPFDAFRDALAAGDAAAIARFPADAQRGLKLFVGRGNCFVCHFGPAFSNGEFHDVGRPFMPAPGRVDPGRHSGIARVLRDRYNLLGPFNDEASAPARAAASGPAPADHDGAALKTRTVTALHSNFGEWRTPSLRGLAATAPYMHDGSLATLEDVVRHYDELNEDRLHADGEALLRPLRLTGQERQDLLAFLRSLNP